LKNILFIEPFHGGSHRDFLKGLVDHSTHRIEVLTLPGRNWLWRLNGSAVHFSKQNIPFEKYDGIVVSGLIRLTDLKALYGKKFPPVLVYFHETQLTYPAPQNGEKNRGIHVGMADVTTALCSDRIVFNSRFHLDSFMEALSRLNESVPDYPFPGIVDEISNKSCVLHPGIDFQMDVTPEKDGSRPPLVIWNHRWNYDKNAPSFFYALNAMADQGVDFKIAVLGENDGNIPEIFLKMKDKLADKIVRFGYVDERKEYVEWLKRGTVAVSTAKQENFGMSTVEAIRYGCIPLLPNRLSYPEIIPRDFHRYFLYDNQKDFLEKFYSILSKPGQYSDISKLDRKSVV
jgi:glycosyltransferase involved in cell wall biosynthesis